MVDTPRTDAAILALLADNTSKAISEQDTRDFAVTVFSRSPISVKQYGAVGNGSTNDNTAIQNAVTAALSAGSILYWPSGTYLTTGSIANLHSVRHFGPGVLSRSGTLFPVAPRAADANGLFVSTSGNDANDGLSSSQAIRTIQRAFNVLENYGPKLSGSWTITLAAGTYNESTSLAECLTGSQRLVIQGPLRAHPLVPTALISGSGLSSALGGMNFTSDNFVELRYVKFINWTAADQWAVKVRRGDLYCVNVHETGTEWVGIYADRLAILYVEGGILDGGRIGINGYAFSVLSTGYQATTSATKTIIRNKTQAGHYLKDGCHCVSNVITEDCTTGMLLWGATADLRQAEFFRNQIGVECRNFGRVNPEGGFLSANGWNRGTANAQTIEDIEVYGPSGVEYAHASAPPVYRVHFSSSTNTHTGNTSLTTLRTLLSYQDYEFKRSTKGLKVRLVGSHSGSGGTKQFRLDFGSTVMVNVTLPTGGADFLVEVDIDFLGTASQMVGYRVFFSSTLAYVRVARAAAMNVASNVNVKCQLSSAGDSVTLNESEIMRIG